MGDSFINKLPSAADAAFIRIGLNDLFGQHLGHCRNKHGQAKQRYPNLLVHDPRATGLDRRQRSLRHAAWLLTDEIFANAAAGHQPTFRYWLRWLTWIERAPPPGFVVNVIGPPVDLFPEDNGILTPAHAILDTLFRAIDRTRTVEFDWNPAPDGGPYLSVTVDRSAAAGPYKISVTSKRWDALDDYTPVTDSEDDF